MTIDRMMHLGSIQGGESSSLCCQKQIFAWVDTLNRNLFFCSKYGHRKRGWLPPRGVVYDGVTTSRQKQKLIIFREEKRTKTIREK
jgi:hypothetical protein